MFSLLLPNFLLLTACAGTTVEADSAECDTNPVECYADADGDLFGDLGATATCGSEAAYIAGDCNDASAAIHPGAIEVCDGIDNNCDGTIDEDTTDGTVWYADADADGFGSMDVRFTTTACAQPEGYVADATDCDDASAAVSPAAIESCDGFDNNCDGNIDGVDADTDGYVDLACDGGDDCDDADGTVNPGATEVCNNGIDEDCDGGPNACGVTGDIDTEDAISVAYGVASGDNFGSDLASNGDITGDGTADLVLSAAGVDPDGIVDGGRTYVIDLPGPGEFFPEAASATVSNETTSEKAGAVTLLADLDGDGIKDLVVGAHRRSNITLFAGALAVYRGGIGLNGEFTYDEAWMQFTGTVTSDFVGARMTPIHDDSGAQDWLAVSAYGNDVGGTNAGVTYILDISAEQLASGGSWDLASEAASFAITGEAENDQAGTMTASADLDGTGVSDLMIGAWQNDAGGENSGAVYIVFDHSFGDQSLEDADAKFIGQEPDDWFGNSIGNFQEFHRPDLDGDGYDELLMTAAKNDNAATDAGTIYLYRGADVAMARGLNDASMAPLTISGSAENDLLGQTFIDSCDFDGDTIADIAVGAYGNADSTGAVGIFYGPLADGDYTLAEADATLRGTAIGDGFGNSGVCIPTTEGGPDGLAVGSNNYDASGVDTDDGAVYVFAGGWF